MSLDEVTKGMNIEKRVSKIGLWRLQQKKSVGKEEPAH